MYGWDRFGANPIDRHLTAVFPTCEHDGEAEFTAAAALDKNSVALSEAIASVYGQAAGDSFLPLWRKHIGFSSTTPSAS